MTSVDSGVNTMVWPSGLPVATSAAATAPPAPVRLATRTPLGNFPFMPSARRRATMSTMPPAGYPERIVTGRSGYCAGAEVAHANARRPASRVRNMPRPPLPEGGNARRSGGDAGTCRRWRYAGGFVDPVSDCDRVLLRRLQRRDLRL